MAQRSTTSTSLPWRVLFGAGAIVVLIGILLYVAAKQADTGADVASRAIKQAPDYVIEWVPGLAQAADAVQVNTASLPTPQQANQSVEDISVIDSYITSLVQSVGKSVGGTSPLVDAYASLAYADLNLARYYLSSNWFGAQGAIWSANDEVMRGEALQNKINGVVSTGSPTPAAVNFLIGRAEAATSSKLRAARTAVSAAASNAGTTAGRGSAGRGGRPSNKPATGSKPGGGTNGGAKQGYNWVYGYTLDSSIPLDTVSVWVQERPGPYNEARHDLSAIRKQTVTVQNQALANWLKEAAEPYGKVGWEHEARWKSVEDGQDIDAGVGIPSGANGENAARAAYTICFDSYKPYRPNTSRMALPYNANATGIDGKPYDATSYINEWANGQWNGLGSNSSYFTIAVPEKKKRRSLIGGTIGKILPYAKAVNLANDLFGKLKKDSKDGKVNPDSRVVTFGITIKMVDGYMQAVVGDAASALDVPDKAKVDVQARYSSHGLNMPLVPNTWGDADKAFKMEQVSQNGDSIIFKLNQPIALTMPMPGVKTDNGIIPFFDQVSKTVGTLAGVTTYTLKVDVTAVANRLTGNVTVIGTATAELPALNPNLKDKYTLLPDGAVVPITFAEATGPFVYSPSCKPTAPANTVTPNPDSSSSPSSSDGFKS